MKPTRTDGMRVSTNVDPLGGRVELPDNTARDNKGYDTFLESAESLKLPKEEKIEVTTSGGDIRSMTLHRDGYTDKGLAELFMDPDATEDRKNSYLANYMFQRGKESSSFLAELYLSKGKLERGTQAFKSEIRFDFEMLTDMIVKLLYSAGMVLGGEDSTKEKLALLSELFNERAAAINTRYQAKIKERMEAKGFGIYIDVMGKPYDTRSNEIMDVVKRDVETTKANLKKKQQ